MLKEQAQGVEHAGRWLLARLGWGESLEGTDLREMDLQGAQLAGVNLSRADLGGANLARVDLKGAVLHNTCLREAFLEGANLEGASLRNADLEGADLTDANLEGTDLARANLDGATLEDAALDLATLENASLVDANLGKARLVGVNLRCADLEGAYLGGARLAEADLRHTTLANTNLEEADLCGADLRGCDLSRVIMDRTILDRAKVFGMELPLDGLRLACVDAWDISRAGDGSLWEEGPRVGASLSQTTGSENDGSPMLLVASRALGPGKLIKDSELLVRAESVVEIEGRVENCQIVLGEDVELKIAPTGLVQGCRIVGQGSIRDVGHKTDELLVGGVTAEEEVGRRDPSPSGRPIDGVLRRSPRGDEATAGRHDLAPRVATEMEKMLSVRQAAEMMNVHTGTLHRWIRTGRLKATKPGRHWRIPESSLRELIEKGDCEPRPSAC